MTALQTATPAIQLETEDRATFVMRVYQHVLAAVVAFVIFEVLLFQIGVAERLYDFFFASGGRWLLFLGAFMGGQWFVAQAANQLDNPPRQYAGLFGTSALYSLLFAPMIYQVYNVSDSKSTLAGAVAVTALGFGFLTVIAFVTRKDLSFLRPLVMWGFGAGLLLIVGALLFGWNLGVWFSVGMIAVSGAAILYQTQAIVRSYPANAHVAAAIQLFGSLMTMFWYVLRLFMQLSRD